MHIIWLTPEFPSSIDNTKGIYIYRTVKELSKHFKITVIALYPAAPPIMEILRYKKDWKKLFKDWKLNYSVENETKEKDNFKIIYLKYYRLPRNKFHHIEGWFAYIQLKNKLKTIVSKDSIIHANWIFPAGTLAKIISVKYKIPFIISLMGSDVNRLIQGSKFWKEADNLLHSANLVTSVAQDLFDQCKNKNIILDKNKTKLIDNIYETNKFIIKNKNEVRQYLNIKNGIKIILYAGGLIPLKNVDILIEAVSKLNKSGLLIKLYIAGSGTEEGNLKRLVQNLNLSDNVIFLGPLIADKLIDYYNAADLFCLQSKSEGLPNVIVESFLCGTPVVATKVGGISTILKNGENGFLAEPNSIVDLTEKIQSALSVKWDQNSIRNSISHLFPENVLNNYMKIYNSLLN